MTYTIIDGRKIAQGRGYARRIERVAAELGVRCFSVVFASTCSQAELFAAVDRLNADSAVSGIIVLRPLPDHIDEWASKNGQLGWHTRRADVLVVAAGVPEVIRSEHVREGAIVLDVGINPVTDVSSGAVHLVGDVDFPAVAPRSRAITPVPRGIGSVTDFCVLRNAANAARQGLACCATPAPSKRWT